jgi:hypothetical protein
MPMQAMPAPMYLAASGSIGLSLSFVWMLKLKCQ